MASDFFRQLYADGRVRLQSGEPASADEIRDAAAWLMTAEQDARQHLPDDPPPVDAGALEWAARMFYGAAQMAVFRHLGPDELKERLDEPLNTDRVTPSVAYSVDVVFRFLPDLIRIVKGMNPEDPLLEILTEWAKQWPLSSVGVKGIEECDVEPVLRDRCLSLMYADRILKAEDTSRLDHPDIAEIIRGIIGAYPELCPAVAGCLEQETTVKNSSL